MLRNPWFSLCAFPALSTVLPASADEHPAAPQSPAATDAPTERGVPALFSWGDVDGDGRLDLAAVSGDGTLQILANTSDGRFEDVTEQVGLFDVGNATIALWADYDGDGRLDLFVGASEGASRLFHNDYGVFIDVSARSGISIEGAVQSAEWLDEDSDGRLDLFVVTGKTSQLFRGLEGGFFKATELSSVLSSRTPATGTTSPTETTAGAGVSPWIDGPEGERADSNTAANGPHDLGSLPKQGRAIGSTRPAIARTTTDGPPFPLAGATCFTEITDQAVPSNCLSASTTPTLGRLYPITSNLFVAAGGNVGIGTTSPAARLDVAGTARMNGTLTLSPSVDKALDVSTGSIYKVGLLFSHTKGILGHNTALGILALKSTTSGEFNTATGFEALYSNTGGFNNTACGEATLFANTSGNNNTASGARVLFYNTTGFNNTASGSGALHDNKTGSRNTACGVQALTRNTTGARNIAIGHYAGRNLTTGNGNIVIGNEGVAGEGHTIRIGNQDQTRAFLAGIRGVTTTNANAIPVFIDNAGQLGTVSSSRRFKKDIADMGDLTKRLLELRPVVFHYKQEQKLPNGAGVPLEYGLIAEEVAEIFPDLVVYDDAGKPLTVKYHLLSAMLLNELKKTNARLDSQDEAHAHEMDEMRNRLATIESRISSVAVPAAIPTGGR